MKTTRQAVMNVNSQRRQFLWGSGMSLGNMALAAMTPSEAGAAAGRATEVRRAVAKAKRVIYLFMHGGPSQLDLLDHKPGLRQHHGQELPASVRGDQRLTGMTSGQKSFPVTASHF